MPLSHTLILGHSPATISTSLRQPYTHSIWYAAEAVAQAWLTSNPDAVPITSLSRGWETIVAEASIRLNRPFIAHAVPHNSEPPVSWYSADKMCYINCLAEASTVHHKIWTTEQTDAVLTLWNGRNNRLRVELNRFSKIPIINLWPEFKGFKPCP